MAVPTSSTLRRFVLTHRRLLAAGFAGLAVLFALGALKPSTDGVRIVVARHDLASGSVLTAEDLHTTRVPTTGRPSHSSTSVTGLVGRRIAGPMRRGEALTDYRLLQPGLLAGYDKGFVLSTVRIADATQLSSIKVGDHVNVIGTDPAGESVSAVIARRVVVVSLPRTESDNNSPAISVAVPEKVGLALAGAALDAQLSVLAVP